MTSSPVIFPSPFRSELRLPAAEISASLSSATNLATSTASETSTALSQFASPGSDFSGAAVGVVYSTNPDFQYQYEDDGGQDETLPPSQQRLHVRMERSGRGGTTVTVVDNFVGTDDDLQDLGRTLKTKCGVGGSVKDGQIIIQGDFRERVTALLRDMGYPTK